VDRGIGKRKKTPASETSLKEVLFLTLVPYKIEKGKRRRRNNERETVGCSRH
jgi:hypothetical protein